MKDWFPFTNYDFWAYLVSGSLLLAALDFAFHDAGFVKATNWPVAQIILLVGGAYVTGHLVAQVSSAVLEHWLARRLLRPASSIILGFVKPTFIERCASAAMVIGKRYYAQRSQGEIDRILDRAAKEGGLPARPTSGEQVFNIAYRVARQDEDMRDRIDDFRNQYGFCRNIATVGFIASGLFWWRSVVDGDATFTPWAWLALVGAIGMTARFLKFYATFGCEPIGALLVERKTT